ncbi:MAG: redoxin domain-containing protein [Salinivirgaceae bacterium]|jgi:thiol-disulfide isomerase/thioredoxin|nr:AhpC/TSA family protein [Bacteroidales bacterium]
MRNVFFVAIMAITASMLFSCKSQKNGGYTVHAEIEGISGSDVVMMIEDPSSPQGFRIDTLKASSDKIKFTGTIDTVRIALITVDDPRHMKMSSEGPIPAMPVQFFIEPKGDIKIKGDVKRMHLSQLKGTLMNDQLNSLLRAAEQQQILVDSVIDLKRNVQMGGLDTPELNEQIKIEYMKLIDIYADFVRKNNDFDIAPFIIKMYISQFYENSQVRELYNQLTDRVKNTTYGKFLAGDFYETPELSIGEYAPDFALIDKDNKRVQLSDFKGNCLIIDFWGSWCKPCRISNPKLVEIVNKYKANGLQIIGIAADKDNDEWLSAIEEDNLDWINVNALNEQPIDVLRLYSIRAFPTKIVVDPEGKVTGIFIGDDPQFYTHIDEIYKQ